MEIIQGDVVGVLPQLLKRDDVGNLLVYLDAHYSGESTVMGPVEEPVLEELMILKLHKKQVAAIVIDDFRTFGSRGMPRKSTVIRLLEDDFSEFSINVHLDQIIAIKKVHNVNEL